MLKMGYANYVWPAYAFLGVFLMANILFTVKQYQQTKQKIRARYASQT